MIWSLVFVFLLVRVDSNCVWYGIGDHSIPDQPKYIAYDGPAKPLDNPDGYKLLSRLCPNYATYPTSKTCCDYEQLKFFSDSSKLAYEILRRCPACWANFRLLLCGMTCDPDQHNFIETNVEEGLVLSATVNLSKRVGDAFYNSCKDVNFGVQRAIDVICESSPCTRDALLAGLGSRGPFPVTYVVVESNTSEASSSFDVPFFRCNETVPPREDDHGGPACSCTDCESSCNEIPPIPPTPVPVILGLNVWWFSGIVAFVVLVLVFATYEVTSRIHRYRHRDTTSRTVDETIRPDNYPQVTESITPGSCAHRLRARLEQKMYQRFEHLGFIIARHPFISLSISITISIVLCAGLSRFTVTTNPVELWSAPTSRSRLEKNYFDKKFLPFYRTEQLIIHPVNQSNFTHMNLYPASGDVDFGPALRKEFLKEVLDLQKQIEALSVKCDYWSQEITLSDICFKPLEPDNMNCAITTPLEYFQGNETLLDEVGTDDFGYITSDYMDHLMFCANSPLSLNGSYPDSSVSCLASSGIPIPPALGFCGFNGTFYNGSTCVVLTFLVNNNPDPRSDHVKKAECWEAKFIEMVKDWAANHSDSVVVSYQAERSVEDEINRQSAADVETVGISYVVMFVYVSIFLASYRSCKTLFVDLRFTLGFGGVIIVMISVVASIGMWSYVGIPATLIIIEVIPFLVLAVGVDNIFILVHEFELDEKDTDAILCTEQRQQGCEHERPTSQLPRASGDDDQVPLHPHPKITETIQMLVAKRMGRTLGHVGPSILLTSTAESVAFFCGSLTSMPAVKAFALYAAVAIAFNFLLQIFAFIALLTLDSRRRAANRFDVCCCFGLKSSSGSQQGITGDDSTAVSPTSPDRPVGEVDSLSLSSSALDDVQLTSQPTPKESRNVSSSIPLLHYVIVKWFAPCLLCGWVRPIIVIISLAWLCFSIAIIPSGIQIGLDQRLAMPEDSYVLRFFDALAKDLRIGPPVYFVVTDGHTYDDRTGQNAVCGGFGCPQKSLSGVISSAARFQTYSWIASPVSSWIDDYFDWIDPDGAPFCCRVYPNSTDHCPDSEPLSNCITCPVKLTDGRPNSTDFYRYLDYFLDQNPGPNCPKAGRAPYHVAVQRTKNHMIGATYFMTYHTVLQKPADFINALRSARHLASQVNEYWHGNQSEVAPTDVLAPNTVFPYSVFYVYYEQYLTVVHDSLVQIGICLAAIMVVTFILLGLNVVATLMVLFGVMYILLSLVALMVLWNISLNAISLVNLVVTVGIAVEFCAHIVRAFTISSESSRVARAKAALSDMGSSILRGITLTKLGGILVLSASKSRLFVVFYFRMYLGIILFGALTGLVVLPVFLSYIGPGFNEVLAREYQERINKRKVDRLRANI